MAHITDCLGRTREAQSYPDGSYNCPFCLAAVLAGTSAHAATACPNPGCYARGGSDMPAYPAAEAERREAAATARKAEQDVWLERQRWAQQAAEERRAEESARIYAVAEEARSRGACVTCAVESARYGRAPKFTRHRAACRRAS